MVNIHLPAILSSNNSQLRRLAHNGSTNIQCCTSRPSYSKKSDATIQLPIDVVGRFIGRQGRNIKSLMAESGSQIHVQSKEPKSEMPLWYLVFYREPIHKSLKL